MQPLTVALSTLLALIPGLIAAAVATALAGLSWMLAIPFIGPILYGAVAGTVVAAATTGLVTLMTAIATFLSVPGEDVAQKLANIVNLATRVNLKFIVPIADQRNRHLSAQSGRRRCPSSTRAFAS